MGREKQETQVSPQTQTVTPKRLPEEKELAQLELERQRAAQPGLIGAQGQGLNLINQLLTGQALPGFLEQLPGGISPQAIGTEATRLAGQNLAGFQQQGIADSGVAFRETAADIASRILLPAEQFNLQNISQLLNLAVGGQAAVQQPILGAGAQLGQRLAGLTPITTTTGGLTQRGQTTTNFFASPFAAGFGQGLGSAFGRV